jgi:four helix bundle protein
MNTNSLQFEDLEAWKSARELARHVYRLCQRAPLSKDYGLSDQLRRAAVSVMNNLADGWESRHTREKAQFYNFARRSCGEVRSMSYLLVDNNLINSNEHADLRNRCISSGKLVSGLLRTVDQN